MVQIKKLKQYVQKFIKKRLSLRTWIIVGVSIIIAGAGIAYYGKAFYKAASATWADGDFSYRQRIPITYTGSENLTEYQVLVDALDTSALVSAGKMQSDCDDIRFYAENGVKLDYFIVPATCNTTDTKIWVKTDTINAGDINIYMYYGNSSISGASNIEKTFSYKLEKTVGYILQSSVDALDVISLSANNSITHNGTTVSLNVGETAMNPFTVSQFAPISAKGLFNADDNSDNTDSIVPVSWAGTEFHYYSRGTGITLYAIAPWGAATVYAYSAGSVLTGCNGASVATTGTTLNCTGVTNPSSIQITSTVPIVVFAELTTTITDPMPLKPITTQSWIGNGSSTIVNNGSSSLDWRWISNSGASETDPSNLSANLYDSSSVTGDSGYGGGAILIRSANSVYNFGVNQMGDGDGSDSHMFNDITEVGTIFGSAHQADYISVAATTAATCSVYNTSSPTPIATTTATSSNTSIYDAEFGTGNSSTYTGGAWYMNCDAPVVASWQDAIDSEEGLMHHVQMRQFTYPTPTVGSFATEEKAPQATAFWQFDEGAGTTPGDSQSGVTGNFSSSPVWKTKGSCITNNCLFFDGTNDYVDTNRDLSWSQTDAFSISVWINPKSIANRTILGKGTSGTTWEYSLRLANYIPSFVYWNTSGAGAISLTSSEGVTLSNWHFLEVTYDGLGNAYLYMDGSVVASQTGISGTFQNRSNDLNIGGGYYNSGAAGYFNGEIDNIRIYNYARSETEVKSDYIKGASASGSSVVLGASDQSYLSNGLQAYWKMDETTWVGSNAVIDSSGNGYSGTSVNGATVGTGRYGNGGSFDGSNDYVSFPAITSSGEYTVSFWWNITPSAAYKFAIGSDSSATNKIGHNNDGTHFFIRAADGGSSDTSVTMPSSGAWHMITVTRNRDNKVDLYVDGGAPTRLYSDVGQEGDAVWGAIGRTGTSGQYINGKLDDMRIYNRAFSSGEVTKLYEFAPGPVAYYDMNEGTGSTANDSSGYGNNGNFASGTGAPTWASGQYGNSLKFDGTNDYVLVPDSNSLDVSGGLTIGAWIKTDDGGASAIVSKYATAPVTAGNFSYWFGIISNNLYMFVSGDGTSVPAWSASTPTIANGEWHYVTGVFDTSGGSSQIKIYYDGVNLSIGTTSGTLPSSLYAGVASVEIGRDTYNGNAIDFRGLIDEVRIYNYGRTQKQIIQDMNGGHPSTGSPVGSPVGYWKMDEGYGSTANNDGNVGSSLNGTFGTGTSAPTWTNDGKFGKGLTFDGTSDYLTVPDNNALDGPDGFTVSIWAQPSQYRGKTQAQGFMISKGIYPTYSYRLLTDGTSGNRFEFASDIGSVGFNSVTSSRTYSTNTWYNVVGTYDGSAMKLYVNGVLDNNYAIGGTVVNNTTSLYMGKYSNGTGYEYKGSLDEAKVYDYALTGDEVKVEYDRGKAIVLGASSTGVGGTGPSFSSSRAYCVPGDTSTCNAPISEWLMDENTGTTAYDTSGNGVTGTLTNGPVWSPGVSGSAVKFDGANDTVSMGDNDDQTSSFTISAWMKTDTLSGTQRIIIKDAGGSNGWALSLGDPGSGMLRFFIRGLSTVSLDTSAIISTNKWYYVAGVFDDANNTKTVYVNGQSVASDSSITGSPTNDTANLLIGGTTSAYFNGLIDNVRIYDYVRTPAQIAWEYNKGAPIARYKMDECEGTTIYNSTRTFNDQPAGSNGTLTIGGTGTNTTVGTCSTSGSRYNGATGKRGAAIDLDNTDDYITITDDDKFSFGDGSTDRPFSVSGWFKADTINSAAFTSAADFIVTKDYNGVGREWSLSVGSSDDMRFAVWDNSASASLAVQYNGITTGRWYHFVGTYDGSATASGLKIYIDGKQVTVTDNSSGSYTAMENGTANVVIGGWATSTSNLFDGLLDDIKIYNYALTPSQVKTDFNNGAVSFE